MMTVISSMLKKSCVAGRAVDAAAGTTAAASPVISPWALGPGDDFDTSE